jgi:site-specific DNA-methyltransferase (adenine-specific)
MSDAPPFALLKRNPDVLTCIANLSNDEVFTPPEFAARMLDTLAEGWASANDGANLWADSSATFLDPCTKTGVFLREIAKRLIVGLANEIPDLRNRVDHILTRQVFGIGTSRLTALLARRSLYCSKWANGAHSVARGFDDVSGNIWFERMEHDWQGNKCQFCGAPRTSLDRGDHRESYAYPFIHIDDPEVRLAEMFGAEMQFDVIIGNPPYQMAGGGGGTNDSAIYHLFVEQAVKLEPRFLSMVIPSRWMAGGRGMEDFRRTMLADRHISHLVDYPNSGQVFPGVDLKSGVCFFLRGRDYQGDCSVTLIRDEVIGPTNRKLDDHDVFIRDERAAAILKKVLARNEPSFSDLLTGDTPFGLATNFSAFRRGEPGDGEVKVYASSNNGRRSGSMLRSAITKNSHLIDSWKVLAPKAGPGSSGGHIIPDIVLSKPSTAEPNSVCTQTWIVVGPLESEEAANSAVSYLQTRFLRFIVSLRKISQDAMRGVYQWVPQQPWDRIWTDAALYEKYGITAEEQAYIESMIRPMESAA